MQSKTGANCQHVFSFVPLLKMPGIWEKWAERQPLVLITSSPQSYAPSPPILKNKSCHVKSLPPSCRCCTVLKRTIGCHIPDSVWPPWGLTQYNNVLITSPTHLKCLCRPEQPRLGAEVCAQSSWWPIRWHFSIDIFCKLELRVVGLRLTLRRGPRQKKDQHLTF